MGRGRVRSGGRGHATQVALELQGRLQGACQLSGTWRSAAASSAGSQVMPPVATDQGWAPTLLASPSRKSSISTCSQADSQQHHHDCNNALPKLSQAASRDAMSSN